MPSSIHARRVTAILGLIAFSILTASDVRDFFRDGGIGYFASEPFRLAYVALITLSAGICALILNRLSAATKRTLTLIALGIFAICLKGLAVQLAILLPTISAIPTASENGNSILVALGSVIIVAILSWFEFFRYWRGKSDKLINN